PSVQQAVVVARADGAGQKQIVAYVTEEQRNKATREQTDNQEPRTKNLGREQENKRTKEQRENPEPRTQNQEPGTDNSPSPAAAGEGAQGGEGLSLHLLRFLRERLPAAMVPASIVVLDALPRTPNGKIDRKALPLPEAILSEHDDHAIAPRTEVEQQLAEIMRAVLRREQISIFGNFFDLGGHSLLATQVVSRIRDAFGINLPLQTIFETPTIAGLAEQIERGRREAAGLESPLLPVPRDRDLPLSFAQQRLWFLDQLEPNNPFYNVPAAVRLAGALDVGALQQSLNALVRRHETLRTTFAVRAAEQGVQEPAQVIAPQLRIDLPVVDLQALAVDEREAEVERITIEESRQPFDLRRGPLIRARLLRLAPGEHVLLLTLHHIISDGWSTRVLIRDLTACYAAFEQGVAPQLPTLPIQYADYAVWQRSSLAGETLESQVSYWRRQLADLPLLDLPTDYPRPAIQDFRGTLQSVMLPRKLTAALRELSQREGTTLFMTLLAAFQVLLGRYSGQTDIVVGAPIANRTRPEIEPLIGFFANTLVLRTDLAAAPTFRDLLGRVRAVALDAYAHQDVPFEKLVELLQPPRDLSRNPFFDVLFNYMDAAQLTLEAPGLTLTPIQTELGSKFAMTLYVDEYAEAIGLRLLYQRSLFAPERIALLLDHFAQLLAQIVAAPAQPLEAYSLVTPASRALLPDPTIELPEPRYELATTLFKSWADRLPEQPALRQDDRSLTYGELANRVEALARQLLARGLQRGDVVAVSGPRSFGLIASMVASMLSGGVMLTIDRNLPAGRQRLMLDEAQARWLLYVGEERAEDRWLHELDSPAIVRVDAHTATAVDPVAAAAATLPDLTPADHAYIFFTSGTTGVPKGVLGWHKGLSHFITWQRETFAIGPGDRSAQLTGLSFNVLLRDVFTPLTSGATLCLPPLESSFGPDDVLPWLEREQITILHTVPSLAQSWLAQVPTGVSLRALRWVFSAGEPLTESLVRRWRAAFPEMRGAIVLLYGQTETTLAKCFFQVPAEIPHGVQPVGRTLPQTQALVLAPSGRLCGIGEPGELALRTPYRTLGYFNAPDEQRRRFVSNPFRADDRDIVYLTGDRARYRRDGSLEVLGRADDQIKIRGIRVEPAEIQSWIARHPAVRAAVVLVREDEIGEQRLVAYVVGENLEPRTQNQADQPLGSRFLVLGSAALRQFLREHLPEYMIPSAFVLLDALPITPNGKVDRRALPAPDLAASERAFVAPRTPTEQTVARIFGEILQREQVGLDDHFFELGGHSLLATQALSRLREAFGIELPLRRMFETPTVAELSAAIDQLKQASAPARTPRIASRSREQHRGVISGRDGVTLPEALKRHLQRED
ncbi:MAG TPA: amino acid adenylation domain-containing protein, partial [Herpetosiphonaceae bacterium]